MKNRAQIFSFFSGVGFLDLGFEDENFEIVYVNENHKPFIEAYKYSREILGYSPPQYGYGYYSIRKILKEPIKTKIDNHIINSRKESNIVGFIGGPPCPDFSVGGKNKGKYGDNGILSRTFIEVIIRFQPDFFLFENVKGLLRTKKHRAFFDELKTDLKGGGYILTEKLINATEYEVPQDRDRIILIGVNKNVIKRNKIDFFSDEMVFNGNFPWSQYAKYAEREAFSFTWPKTIPFKEDSIIPKPKGIPVDLTVQYWFEKNDVNNHPNSFHHFKPRAGLKRFKTIDEGDDSKKSFKRLHRWRYSPTASYGNNEVHIHPYKPRRITVAEALAIQSMPKSFILPSDMSLTNMFKAIGNGVPYCASKALAKSLNKFLAEIL